MRIVPTLLRVILVLSLVLNGTDLATAHAASAGTDALAPAAAHVMPDAEAPCHDAQGVSDADQGEAAKATLSDHHDGSDCCEGEAGSCDNACPQPVSATLAPAAVAGLHLRPVSHPQGVPAAHAGPGLTHPIRPPIA